jgi:Flp pilus assembly protein TadD
MAWRRRPHRPGGYSPPHAMTPVSRWSPEKVDTPSDYRDSADREQVREWGLRAGRQLEDGKIREAEITLRLALGKMPSDPRCRSLLAVCLATGRGKLVTAERLARGVVEQDAGDPVAQYALGRVLIETGDRRQAFRCFARARSLAGTDKVLKASVARQDPRRAKMFPALARNHALNVFFGRLFRRLRAPGR